MIKLTIILALAQALSLSEAFAIRGPAVVGRLDRHSTLTKTVLKAFDLASTVNAVDAFYHSQPYAAAFMTCSFKASAADLVAQQSQSGDSQKTMKGSSDGVSASATADFDIQRNIGFLLYGGVYQGCVQEFLYNNVFPSVFGDSHSWTTVLEQVALDMAVLTPFLCLPVAYAMKAVLSSEDSLEDALCKYISHVKNEGLLVRYWSIWAPVQVLTFGFVPMHLRIPFIAFVSFFWLMILSNISSQDSEAVKE